MRGFFILYQLTLVLTTGFFTHCKSHELLYSGSASWLASHEGSKNVTGPLSRFTRTWGPHAALHALLVQGEMKLAPYNTLSGFDAAVPAGAFPAGVICISPRCTATLDGSASIFRAAEKRRQVFTHLDFSDRAAEFSDQQNADNNNIRYRMPDFDYGSTRSTIHPDDWGCALD